MEQARKESHVCPVEISALQQIQDTKFPEIFAPNEQHVPPKPMTRPPSNVIAEPAPAPGEYEAEPGILKLIIAGAIVCVRSDCGHDLLPVDHNEASTGFFSKAAGAQWGSPKSPESINPAKPAPSKEQHRLPRFGRQCCVQSASTRSLLIPLIEWQSQDAHATFIGIVGHSVASRKWRRRKQLASFLATRGISRKPPRTDWGRQLRQWSARFCSSTQFFYLVIQFVHSDEEIMHVIKHI